VNFFGTFWKFSEIIGNYWRGARRRISSDGFLNGEFFFWKFLEIIGKYCRDVRREVSSDLLLKGEFFRNFFEIFGNYWKLLTGCETTSLFRRVLKWWIFFWKFLEIFGNYCRSARRRFSSDGFLKGEFFSEIFWNYWKILSGSEETSLFKRVLKGWIYSEIFGNYWKILSWCEMTSLFRQVLKGWIFSERFGNFRKLLENIGNYCQGARRRVSSDGFLNGEFLFGNFRNLLENNVRVWDDESLETGS